MDSGGLPIGGTTGLSHQHSAAIDEAARWLVDTPTHMRSQPVIGELRKRFGLSTDQACAACREANLIRARAT